MNRIEAIIEATCLLHNLTNGELMGNGRYIYVTHPRQWAIVAALQWAGLGLCDIGRAFGGKHHTTVRHARHAVEKRNEQGQVDNIIKIASGLIEGGFDVEAVDLGASPERTRTYAAKYHAHLAEKQERIKTLEEQNRRLHAENVDLKSKLKTANCRSLSQREVFSLREEVDFLKAENRDLQKQLVSTLPFLPSAQKKNVSAYLEYAA
jgi:hypothetical protein